MGYRVRTLLRNRLTTMAISTDAMNVLNAPGTETDGEDLFLKRFMKDAPKEPSEERVEDEQRRRPTPTEPAEEDHTPDQDDQPEDAQNDEPSEDGQKGEEKDSRLWIDDDEENVYTKVKVGEEEKEVSVSSLKKLYGQEAALTQRSMQLAETRKKLETAEASSLAAQNLLLQYAQKRYAPYSQINFLELARDPRVTKEQYEYVRGQAEQAYNEVQFLQNQTGELMKTVNERYATQMRDTATATIKELQDPASPNHIDGWSNDMYNELRSFAMSEGIPKDVVNAIVDAPIVRLLRYAQLYKAGKSANVKTEIKNKQVTRVVKTTRNAQITSKGIAGNQGKSMAKLRRTGDVDDAADVFFQGFKTNIDR